MVHIMYPRVEVPVLDALLQHMLWLPLLMGTLYMVARVAFSQGVWQLRHGLERHANPWTARLRYGIEWSFARQVAGVVLAVGYLFAMLFSGVFAASDVGLLTLEDEAAPAWVYGVIPGAAVWVAMLWGSMWQRKRRMSQGALLPRRGAFDPLTLLEREATLGILRGALLPLAGGYWGVWLAVLVSWVASRASPFVRARRTEPGERDMVYLHWALDWVSAALFIVSGSVWLALAGRVAGHIAAWLAWRVALYRRPTVSVAR
jgi:hypothetical protein